MTQDAPSIEQFVRGSLGCQCPDDVFLSVELSGLPGPTGGMRLVVGRRLLIYAIASRDAADLAEAVRNFTAVGREERDDRGLSRFRLVIASDGPDGARDTATAAFSGIATGDDRAHLHWLPPADLPAALSSRGRRSGGAG